MRTQEARRSTSTPAVDATEAKPRSMRWLLDAARKANIAGASELQLDEGVSADEAWDVVARSCGMPMEQLLQAVANQVRMKVADLDAVETRSLKHVPERIARRHQVVPLREDDKQIVIATSEPGDYEAERAIEFSSGRRVAFELATPRAISDALDAHYAPQRQVEALLSNVDMQLAEAVRVVEDSGPEQLGSKEAEAAPVIQLTNLILRDAIVAGASDVHLEPGTRQAVVRIRVDGVMRTQMNLPMAAHNRVVSRIKILGKLDIADRMRPQDGRARVVVDDATYDLRISTVPVRESEKSVIRILRPDATRKLDSLGIPAHEMRRMRQLLSYREGIVVVTGPTGSGKTTTLYSAIKELSTGESNIMTVEDPVEYELPGITQIQVELKRNVTFASALRAVLRQDPDIIFVGEIRDEETARIAAQAAMTGHLVLATLHTNDAIGIVARLVDLGLDRATVAGSLRGALGQRLLRKVCPDCAVPVGDELTIDEVRLVQAYGTRPAKRAVGCKRCGMTGYRGRMPVQEVLIAGGEFSELISSGASPSTLQRAALAGGMRTLREVALERVRAGDTTLQEVERVVGDIGETTRQVAVRRVLLVDDDPVERHLARAVLEQAGYTVDECEDGQAALDHLAKAVPDLVVADLRMPRLDGAALLGKLMADSRTRRTPVVMLTGSGDDDAEAKLLDAGAEDYIRKPIDPPRFLARVKAALRRLEQ